MSQQYKRIAVKIGSNVLTRKAGQAHQPLLRTVPRAPLAGGAGADDEREFQYAPPLPEPTELYDGDVGKWSHPDCERE